MNLQIVAKVILIASCLALVECKPSNGLLLANFIGCNSFGCRIQALESDVAQLKQQVARLDPSGMNNMRPNGMMNQLPYNPNNMNQGMQGNMQNNQQQQQQPGNQPQQQGGNRVSYALDYPVSQGGLQRASSNYPNSLNNQQFFRA